MGMASVAGAATNKLGGEVKGADDAKVSMTVALNNQGDPARVKDLKITGLDYACEDGTTVERGVNLGDTNVRRKGGYSVALDLTARRQGIYVRWLVSFQINDAGTKARGTVYSEYPFYVDPAAGEPTCKSKPGGSRFGAKAK
jgi:hypothetical protein